MKRKIVKYVLGLLLLAAVVVRIYFVNTHARLPERIQVEQGDCLICGGLSYRVEDAVLYGYDEFFESHEGTKEFRDYTQDESARKVLLVTMSVEKVEDGNGLNFYMPIEYCHLFNGVDPFLYQAMNPGIVDGSFMSGDSLLVPYEIYQENLTDGQWEAVQALDMEYRIVLGTYPVRSELMVCDVHRPAQIKGDGNE